MKRVFVAVIAAAVFVACSNEFDVSAPWKSIPVAYAVFSPKDTAHYLRVEKAFLDPEVSALSVARIPDSLYYPEDEIAVYLQQVENGKKYKMYRVDGNLEGYVRKDGIFANQPNWLYKIRPQEMDGGFEEGKTYRMLVEFSDDRKPVTAETVIPRSFQLVAPNPSDVIPKIGFPFEKFEEMEWRADAAAKYFNVTMIIRFTRRSPTNQLISDHTLVWKPVINQKASNNQIGNFYRTIAQIPSNLFYDFMSKNVVSPGVDFHYFEDCDILLEGGGAEIEKYLQTISANLGLTGSEVINNFTNLSEGFGLVTSKNSVLVKNVKFTTTTVDGLNKDPKTIPLKFRY